MADIDADNAGDAGDAGAVVPQVWPIWPNSVFEGFGRVQTWKLWKPA